MKESNICGIVATIIELEKGGDALTNVEYKQGEMDVLHTDKLGTRTYYEIKSSNKDKYIVKGIKQVRRAIHYGQCDKGYVITPNEWFKVQ